MATQSHAGKAIALRERYETLAVTLRGEHQFQNEQAERRTIGRYQALEYLAANLSSIVAGMRPAQVHEVTLRELYRQASAKATWLVNSIRKRRLYHINQLGEWTAEGAIAQIDAMVPDLCGLLLPRLTPANGIHSRYFQVWKPLVLDEVDDLQRIATRWAWAREHWHHEVAILEFADENVTPDQCYQGIGLVGRRGGPKLLWSLDEADLGQTGRGDVIASLLSGEAWVLDGNGLQPVSAILKAPAGATTKGETGDLAGPFARFASRYRLALRIDAGPLPNALICSDPFFEGLAERYRGKTPPHDLWKLALYFRDERGQARAGSPELPLIWECGWRPTFDEVLGILQDMIDTVWDATLRCCSREVWAEYGGDFAEPGEEDRVYGVQRWNVDRLLGFLGAEAFDALRTIEG